MFKRIKEKFEEWLYKDELPNDYVGDPAHYYADKVIARNVAKINKPLKKEHTFRNLFFSILFVLIFVIIIGLLLR